MSPPTSVPPSPRPPPDVVFYDGGCGLCHRTVRFALLRDRDGTRFRFAPLQGETYAARIAAARRAALPDSVVVLTGDGRLLTRTQGVLHLLTRLGGGWRLAARCLGLVPRPLRDLGYDAVARLRKRLFRRPPELCPRVPPALRKRFDP